MARYLLFLLSFSFLLSDTSVRQNIRIKHNLEGLLNLSQFQSRNEQELIEFIESVMESDNIPGLSVSVVKGEHMIWNKSFGLANVEENVLIESGLGATQLIGPFQDLFTIALLITSHKSLRCIQLIH